MSSADVAVKVFLELKNEDFRVLQAIETAMSEHEFVSGEQIARFTKLDLLRDTDFRINRLSKLGLIYRMRGAYTGYTLNYAGYDCLAINGLVKANVLEAFGKSLGVGKEADVYDALKPSGERIAVKFHRLGRISFRQIIRRRSYSTERSASWLYQSRLAAQREYQALQILFPCGVAVPEPISQNRHVVAMGIIEGGELADYKRLSRTERILKEILRNARKAYVKAGIIHADLSEYNVILKPDRHILIIDWPQYVTKEHPNAEELLKRDVHNILQYFKRKHKVNASLEETMEYVTGKNRSLILQVRPA
ncbi:MAG: RIO1 family regulatory kinase/ATPase [Candidatus Bathyarchaeia archaeon]|jgi:RIO kinase 2